MKVLDNIKKKFSDLFKKRQVVKETVYVRQFNAAKNSRFTQWITPVFGINKQLKLDIEKLIKRARELAKNSDLVRSYLSCMERNIIGNCGFILQSLVASKITGDLLPVNEKIEHDWWKYTKKSTCYCSWDESMSGADLDVMILRSLLVDGQVFIRIHENSDSPYGVSFEVIDALTVDWRKNRLKTAHVNPIFAGVEVDDRDRPVQYWMRTFNRRDIRLRHIIYNPGT